MIGPTTCSISFTIDYTSNLSLKTATAIYKHQTTNETGTYAIPLTDIDGLITLPVSNLTPGVYDLTIILTDQNDTVSNKTATFRIGNCPTTLTPVASATAASTNLTLPNNSTTLTGSVTNMTGNPTYLWTKTGLQNAIISNPTNAITQVSGLALGPNTFQVSVTGNNTTVSSTVTVNVTGLRPASISSVSVSPSSPNTNTYLTGIAAVSNLDNIPGLQYHWSLNGVAIGTTSTNQISLGTLSAGSKSLQVDLIGSSGNSKTTNFTVIQASSGGGGGGSFLAGTLVRMSNGSLQKVENIKLGDELIGSQGNVKVLKMYTYESDAKKYRLNEDNYFVTETHPIMTDKGWKSFNPEKTKTIVPSIEVSLLQKGDILIKEDGKREILTNTDFITDPHLVYNFGVSDTNDFYANGYLVHNKMAYISTPLD